VANQPAVSSRIDYMKPRFEAGFFIGSLPDLPEGRVLNVLTLCCVTLM